MPTKLIVGGVLAVSIASPVVGFLLAIAAAPFGHLLAVTVSVENFRMAEAITLAFLTGWLLHGWADRDGPRMPRFIPAFFAAAVVASALGLAWQLSQSPGELSRDLNLLIRAYNLSADRIGVIAGARLLEGVAVAAATVTLFRAHPRLAVIIPAVLAGAGTAAAAASWLLWQGIAPEAVLRAHALNGYRVAAHVIDANAAGSYFAMLVCLAVGMAWRARDRRTRAIWVAMAAAAGLGVWLTASRSAAAAVVLATTVFLVWSVAARSRSRRVVMGAIGAAGLMAVAGSAVLWTLSHDQLSRGTSYRLQFNETSLRMIADRPVIGVGIGQYASQSALFLSPELAWEYGFENAHNYFLQVAAELGLPGFALFAGLFIAGLWRAARAMMTSPEDARLAGVVCGTAAWLGTALVSHPFLVDEVALPFWVQFGLLLGLSAAVLRAPITATPTQPASRRWLMRAGVAAAAGYVALSPPLREWRGTLQPPDESAVTGCSDWETDRDGTRYRWAREYASLFVPADTVHVDVPIRVGAGAGALDTVTVVTSVNGKHGLPAPVVATWSTIGVDLAPASPPARATRVNFRILHTWEPEAALARPANRRSSGVEIAGPRVRR